MLAHEQFGIPLPLNPQNPFKVSIRRLVNEGITKPEGPLEIIDKTIMKEWVEQVNIWFRTNDLPVTVELVKYPVPAYKVQGVDGWKNLLDGVDFRSAPELILTLDMICGELQKVGDNTGFIYEFIDLLKQELGHFEYYKLTEKYPVLRMN